MFAPGDGGGSGKREQVNGEEIVRDGDLKSFLESDFLAGYLQDKISDHPQYAEIPQVVEGFLLRLFSFPEAKGYLLTSSVAKCIAHGTPPTFWEYRKYFRRKIETPAGQGALGEEAKSFLERLSGEPDMDLKVIWRDEDKPITALSRLLARHLGIEEVDIHRELVGVDGQEQYYQETYEANVNEHFRVKVTAGAISTNLRRNRFTIALSDTASGERVFHIDIGELSRSADGAYTDKRLGATSRKQDRCYAHLTVVDGAIQYKLPRSAYDVMRGPDAIVTETEDAPDLVEVALRALRMNLLHEVPELSQLEDLSPQFTSESLFAFAERIHKLVLAGRQSLEQVNPLLMQELAVCLAIDPLITVQFLRDSGLAQLIPGLRRITRDQWNDLLRSRHFVVTLGDAITAPRKHERTFGFMEQQRRTYLSSLGDPNGLERFISALQEVGCLSRGNPWNLFLRLWELPYEKSIRFAKEGRPIVIPPNYVPLVVLGESIILVAPQTASNRSGVLLALQQAGLEALNVVQAEDATLTDKVNDAVRGLRRYAGDMHLEADFDNLNERVFSLALLYAILDTFPSGLSARQLKNLYFATDTTFAKHSDFADLFATLKQSGLVYKQVQERLKREGEQVRVVFYSLRSDRTITPIGSIDRDSHFLDTLEKVLERLYISYDDITIKRRATRMVNILARSGIKNIEALLSFTSEDIAIIARRSGKNVESLEQTVNAILTTCMWLRAEASEMEE